VSADAAVASFEGAIVNAHADNLLNKLRNELASLPGATSMTFHTQQRWNLCLIMAASDEAVVSLGQELGLALGIKCEKQEGTASAAGAERAARAESWWRHTAVGMRGSLRCEVHGPRHPGQPPDIRAERAQRMPTAPVTLTAEQVLEVARARGVRAFDAPPGEGLILLASLGLDLQCDGVRAALLELHQRGELRLVTISNLSRVRAKLAAQGLRVALVDDSALHLGSTSFHAVVLA